MKTGFFQSISGNNSSSRLIAFIVVMISLAFTGFVLWSGLSKDNADILVTTTAAGTLFLQVAGSAMAFVFIQKKTEVKQEVKNENPT